MGSFEAEARKAGEPMKRVVWQIIAPHFVAGVEFTEAGVVDRAAPILKYMKGWNFRKVQEYCRRQQWKVDAVD